MTDPTLVLLADDDDALRGLVAGALRADGHRVEEFATGASLLRRLRAMATGAPAPHAIATDLHMPGATGLDVLAFRNDEMPEVPVLLITALGDPRMHRRARSLGAAAVLVKPVDLAHLTALISRAINRTP